VRHLFPALALALVTACTHPAAQPPSSPAPAAPPTVADDPADPADPADPVDPANVFESQVMLRGYCHAYSQGSEGLGGYWASPNLPRSGAHEGVEGLALVVQPHAVTEFQGGAGMTLWLVNASGARVGFSASDSRLSLVQEVRTEEGWRPIEYLPSSWCGNSYHVVFLEDDEHWQFAVPRYAGPVEAELRFRLTGIRGYEVEEIVSAPYRGGYHPSQLSDKQGHTPTNVMDPYDD
jgi:hypothetical protein